MDAETGIIPILLQGLYSALSSKDTKQNVAKDEQKQMIRGIVLETLADKSNSSQHNEILKRMLDVLEYSTTQSTKQQEKKSAIDLEKLDLLIKNLTTRDHSKQEIDEEKKLGRQKMILKMLHLEEMNTGNNSRSSWFDNDKYSGRGGGRGNFQSRQDDRTQYTGQSRGREKSQTRQDKSLRAYSPPQRGGYDRIPQSHHQSRGNLAGSGSPRRGVCNQQASNYRGGKSASPSRRGELVRAKSPRRGDRATSPPRRGDRARSPPRSGAYNQQGSNYREEKSRSSSRGAALNLQHPHHRDQAKGGPPNTQNYQRGMDYRDHSKHFPSEGFYNEVAGPPQYPQDNYQQYRDPNGHPRQYDKNHQMWGSMNNQQDHDHNHPSVNYQNVPPLLNNYQNVPPPPHYFQNVLSPTHHYQNHPAQDPHGQSYVETRQQSNYGGNYRGRGFVGQNRPFNRGARHYVQQMHSQGGSMHNNQQQPPNMNDRVQEGSTRNSNPCLNLTPGAGEFTSITNVIINKELTKAKGAKKKNNVTTLKTKLKPTQKGSTSDEDESDSEQHGKSSEDEAAKAETIKTANLLKKKKNKNKKENKETKATTKETPTTEKEKTKDDSGVAVTEEKSMKTGENLQKKKKKSKENSKELDYMQAAINELSTNEKADEDGDDSEASQTKGKSGTTPKEGESNSGWANTEGKSKLLQLFIESGHLMDLPEGVGLDQEIDDVVFMARDEEGKIVSFQPKTICEFIEFKKKYPNAKAVIVH